MSATREWLTPAEAANRLGVHVRTLYDGCADGDVPHRRVGRRVLIPRWWADGDDLGRATVPDAPPGTVLDLYARDDDEATRDGSRI